jgi:acetyl esterase/lipase
VKLKFSSFLLLAGLLCVATTPAQIVKGKRSAARAADGEELSFTGARAETYKTIGDVKLAIHIFSPDGHKSEDHRAAIVFFFGGGWVGGSPRSFEQQCRYLASRGMVAMTADYRVFNRQGTRADKCVEDAKSAVRWVRANAKRLGVDPDRIAAGGGSAGGHIAACTGVIEGFEAVGEDTKVSSVPNAMVLFNPALVLAPIPSRETNSNERMKEFETRMGTKPENISPTHHVRKGAPPTLVQHGKEDATVPYWTTEAFADAMKKAGNRCELVGYEGEKHGFFNVGRGGSNKNFIATTKRMDEFLTSLGYLQGKPTVDEFARSATKR